MYVGLPDDEARRHILQNHLGKVPHDPSLDVSYLVSKVNTHVQWNGPTPLTIVVQTDNYSGAEVVAVCREASLFALEENINAENITSSHFEKALNKVKPRISAESIAFYQRFQAREIK